MTSEKARITDLSLWRRLCADSVARIGEGLVLDGTTSSRQRVLAAQQKHLAIEIVNLAVADQSGWATFQAMETMAATSLCQATLADEQATLAVRQADKQAKLSAEQAIKDKRQTRESAKRATEKHIFVSLALGIALCSNNLSTCTKIVLYLIAQLILLEGYSKIKVALM